MQNVIIGSKFFVVGTLSLFTLVVIKVLKTKCIRWYSRNPCCPWPKLDLVVPPRPSLLSVCLDVQSNNRNMYLCWILFLFTFTFFLIHFHFRLTDVPIAKNWGRYKLQCMRIELWLETFRCYNFPCVWIFETFHACEHSMIYSVSLEICAAVAVLAKRWTREIWNFYHSLTAGEATSYLEIRKNLQKTTVWGCQTIPFLQFV